MSTPPLTNQIEIGLIGAYIQNADLFDKVSHLVSENIFIRPIIKECYKAIKHLHSTNTQPDLVILFNHLKKIGYSQADIAIISGAANIEYTYKSQPEKYVDILFKQSAVRYLLPILSDTHQKLISETGDPLDLITKVKDSITNIDLVANNVIKEKTTTDLFDETLAEIKEAMTSNKGMGYSTGLHELDKFTGGLSPGIVVIGGRPGMGKTAITVKIIVENAINNNVPVVMFSLEMPAKQMMRRVMSNAAKVNSYAIKTGQINDEDLKKIENTQIRLKNNLIIDDTPAITWQYIDAKLRNVRKKHPITKEMIVIVDYMQLMSNTADEAKGRTDEALMSIRCNKMNAMWKTYNACIIELSQLGREVEKRVPPRPKMSDLKDSGALEANADVVILQYRPDYYTEFPKDDKGMDLRGLGELNVAKNRHGKVGSAYAKFMGQYSDFEDYKPDNQIHTGSSESF